jgi:uncharacterized protein (TIGR02996 family)
MSEPDHATLAKTLEAGDLEGPSRELGVALDKRALAALRKLAGIGLWPRIQPGLPRLLAMLYQAAHSGEGFVYERLDQDSYRTHCLALRWTDGKQRPHVSVAVKASELKTIRGVWKELEAWSRAPGKHAEAAAAWGKAKGRLQLVVRPDTRITTNTSVDGDDEALRQAVVDAPDDDGPRQVIADWLLERGDLHGELIGLQLQHAKLRPTSPQAVALTARIKPLLDANRARFARAAGPYKPVFRRGFVDGVTMSVAAFVKDGERVFSREPVRTLHIENERFTAAELGRLADTPALGLVRDLRLAQANLTRTGLPLARLGESPHLGKLESLWFDHCGVSEDDWESLFGNLRAPRLANVHLLIARACASVYDALAVNPTLAGLRRLAVRHGGGLRRPTRSFSLAALAAKRPLLEELEIAYAGALDDDALAPFFSTKKSKGGAGLRRLYLLGAPVGDEAAEQIARSPRSAALESLELYDSRMSLDGIATLLRSDKLSRLQLFGTWDDAIHRNATAYADLLLALPKTHPLQTIRITYRFDKAVVERLKTRFKVVLK